MKLRNRLSFRSSAAGIVAFALFAGSAAAQHGQYRGPVDELRNDFRGRSNPRLGGDVPRVPGEGDGSTPGTAAGAGPRRRGPFGVDAEGFRRWEFWWEYNKDLYLQVWNLRNRETTDIVYGSLDFYLGRRNRLDASVTEPIGADSRRRLITPALVEAANDPEPMVKAAALIALAKVKDGATPSMFKERFGDSNSLVREAAYLGAGILGDLAIVPALLDSLNSPTADVSVRTDAALALGLLGRPEVTPYLVEFLRKNVGSVENRGEDVSVAAIDALGISGDKAAVPFLVETIHSGQLRSDKLRSFVLGALGRLRDRQALPVLIKALIDKDLDTRRAAALALGEIDYYSSEEIEVAPLIDRKAKWTEKETLTHDALEALDSLIAEKQNESEKERKELRRLRDIASKALAHVVREDNDNQTRNYAAISLGKVAGSASREALVWALDTGYSRSLQSFAALGLGILGDPSVSPLLLRKLSLVGEESLRGAVAIGLGLLREPTAVEPLLQIVTNRGGDRDFRGYAAIALGLAGAREALPVVQKTLEEEGDDKDIARGFSLALGILGDRDCVPPLVSILDKKVRPDEARGAAVIAFGMLRDSSALKLLVGLLRNHSASPDVRAFAAGALGYLGDTERITALSRLARNHDYRLYVEPLESVFKVL
jgi:HEAT repeat protein